MGIFDYARANLQKVAAVAGIPAGIVAAEQNAGMDNTTPLGPGTPIAPSDGFSTTPRAFDYRSGYNIAGKPRINAAVSFPTMRAVIDAYDVAQICITHRIDSIRSYDWSLSPVPGVTDDMDSAIQLATRILDRLDPSDPDLGFEGWLSKYLWDVLAFDAGALYRVRNRGGQVMGLRVIDGTTIAPLLDAWGNKPGYDYESGTWAPAYLQYVQGMTWDWLTVRDMIYAPFRPISNTPYGRAPIETILLNANTDIRFQVYFLQRFTAGNVPEGFAVSPDTWTPEQIEQWQNKWDAFLQGDQNILSQIKWVPPGTTFEFPNKHEFTSDFPEYLMRKTASAYHVSPNELGFTEDVNRSTGDVQVSVQERVGDLPLMKHVQGILTRFLRDDLGMPLQFKFNTGNDDADNLALAESDKIYIDMGAVSPSDIAEMRFGIIDDEGQRVPRFVMTPQGPVPLSTIIAASAPVNAETAAPVPGTVQPGSIEPAALAPGSVQALDKRALEAAPARPTIVKLDDAGRAEIGTFRRFAKARIRAGAWRDFEFKHVDGVTAHRLNVAGYAEIRKAEGVPTVAGLALRAADTGRVLMLQRALDPDDPAAGAWEFPGGHVEPGESVLEAACREWSEEVGQPVPAGTLGGEWISSNGKYAGHVWEVESESCCTPHDRSGGLVNPDDPDGDAVEAVAWWNPADLVGNPAVRAELADDLAFVLRALHPVGMPSESALTEAIIEDPDLGVGEAVAMAERIDASGELVKDEHIGGRTLIDSPGHAPFVPLAEILADGTPVDDMLLPADGDDVDPFVKAAWRDSSAHAPQHEYDVIITDAYVDRVRDALLQLVSDSDVSDVITTLAAQLDATVEAQSGLTKADGDFEQIDETGKNVGRISRADAARIMYGDNSPQHLKALAREQAAAGVKPVAEQKLIDIVTQIREDGFTSGLHAAAEQLAAHSVTVGADLVPTVDVDWAKWKPGDTIALGEVAAGALRQTLADIGITVRGVTDSVLDTIGNRIGDGLLAGDSVATIERRIRDELGGVPGKVSYRAERIAHTEVARAQTSASMLVYESMGVTEYEVLLADGACDECVEIAAAGPYPLNDPTGRVPIHPLCRCADAPVASSIDPDRIETVDAAEPDGTESADFVSPDPEWVATVPDDIQPEDREALTQWTTEHDPIQQRLRGLTDAYDGPPFTERIERMDRVMQSHVLPHDMQLFRVERSEAAFGVRDSSELQELIGREFVWNGFTATTYPDNPDVKPGYLEYGVTILAPAGTHGVAIQGLSVAPDEKEVLLDRGLTVRLVEVTKDPTGHTTSLVVEIVKR